MFNQQLTADQRLTRAVVDIMAIPEYIALQGVLMVGSKRVSDTIPTACTNGRDEMYGRAFIDSLSDAELRFLVLHECYHKMYRHLTTWRPLYKENAELANAACDYCINGKLMNDITKLGVSIAMPTEKDGTLKGLYDPQYDGMDSAQIYQLLKQQAQQQPQQQPQGGKGKGKSAGKGGGMPSLDEHDWEGAEEMTPEEAHALEREIDMAVRQGVAVAGKLGTGGIRNLEDLLEPKIDWREVLREFVSTTCTGRDFSTWRRPNRRYVSSGVYLPTAISEAVGELVLAIDTSGSIGGRQLMQFLGEVKGICDTVNPQRVRLLYWDTKVCRSEVYEQGELDKLVQSTKPAGGGGTTVECVPEYMQENRITPQAVVVLTDGYLGGSWGQWNCPVLWCILNNKHTTAGVGRTVHIED